MAKSIQGLPGFQWVYKGKNNPFTGETATARYAYNPATGERLTYRSAYTRAHGGVSHEKRVPQAQRKQYARKEKGYTRYGPFATFGQAAKEMKGTGSKDSVLRVYGKTKKRAVQTPKGKQQRRSGKKGGRVYSTVSQLMDWNQMKANLERLEKGDPGDNPFEQRIDRNLQQFETIEKVFIVVKD